MPTLRERFEAWQRWWAAQAGPTPEQRQAAEDERMRQAGQAFTDEVLRACARNGGVYFPGDGDEPRVPGPGLAVTSREPDSGGWYGWLRW